MIQVNLVPDVKAEFLKAQRMKRLVMVIAFLVSGGLGAITILMFIFVNVAQQQHTDNLQADIDSAITELSNTEDLDKVLTIRKQLDTLPGLHAEKPVFSRLPGFLEEVIPAGVVIDTLSIDIENATISFTGAAQDQVAVNVFADTLKAAQYSLQSVEDDSARAFVNVTLGTFGTNPDAVEGEFASQLSITAEFDPLLFDSGDEVELIVPNIITTRSEVEQPRSLFDDSFNEQSAQGAEPSAEDL